MIVAPALSDVAGILFDKDGTLIDYEATWGAANWRAAYFFADGCKDLAEALMEAGGWDRETGTTKPGSPLVVDTIEEIAEVWTAVLPPHKRDVEAMKSLLYVMMTTDLTAEPLTDLHALFDGLRGMGLRLGVATNDTEAGALATLEPLDVVRKLDFIAGYDSGHGAKPAPGMVLAFADHIEAAPARVVMVGDNVHDLESGRSAGAITVGVLTGNTPRDSLEPLADHILDNVSGLMALLAGRPTNRL